MLPARLHPKKIVYFSDGAALQYKNRKMILESKLNGIFQPFHMERGHVMDGIVKRQAARASLQMPYNDQLMTPRWLFDWACSNIPAAYFGYCSNEDYVREQNSLECCFQLSRTIPGTRKLHSFVSISDSTVEVKFYSCFQEKESSSSKE